MTTSTNPFSRAIERIQARQAARVIVPELPPGQVRTRYGFGHRVEAATSARGFRIGRCDLVGGEPRDLVRRLVLGIGTRPRAPGRLLTYCAYCARRRWHRISRAGHLLTPIGCDCRATRPARPAPAPWMTPSRERRNP